MKRIVILMIAAMLCFVLTACTDNYQGSIFEKPAVNDSADIAAVPTQNPAPEQTPEPSPVPEPSAEPVPTKEPAEKPEPTQELPWLPKPAEDEGSSNPETILFLDPDIDIFIMVSIPDWTYITQSGEVFFYPADDDSGNTGMAISSHDKGMYTIEMVWADITEAMGQYFSAFEWEQTDSIMAGEYSAEHYSFTTEGVVGDYFFWHSQSRLYICTFTAFENEYVDLYPLAVESIGTFVAVSEMNN